MTRDAPTFVIKCLSLSGMMRPPSPRYRMSLFLRVSKQTLDATAELEPYRLLSWNPLRAGFSSTTTGFTPS